MRFRDRFLQFLTGRGGNLRGTPGSGPEPFPNVPNIPDIPDFPEMPGLPPWPRHQHDPFPLPQLPDPLKPREGTNPFPNIPQPPPLRDEARRRADPASGDADYLEVVRLAETCAAFEVEWGDPLAEFERTYGGMIGLQVLPPPAPKALPPSYLIGHLDNGELVNLVIPEFEFGPQPSDVMLEPRRLDTLMSEMTAIADRCASNRQFQRELATQGANLAFALIEFLKRDRIYRAQLADGLLSTPYIEATRALDAGKIAQGAAFARASHQTSLLRNQYDPAKLAEVSNAAQRSAWATGRNAFTNPDPGAAAEHAWGTEVKKTVSEHLRIAAEAIAARSADLEREDIDITATVASSAGEQATHQNVALRERAHLATAAIRDELARHRTSIDVVKAKLRVACAPGGAFNYAEQEGQVRRRLERDYRALAARIPVLATGLSTVLGVDLALPATLHRQLPDAVRRRVGDPVGSPTGDVLEDVLTWTRMAVEQMLAQRHADEHLTLTVSLAQALGVKWDQFKRGGAATFTLAGADFAGRRQLRLAAVGATAVGSLSGHAIQLRLKVPTKGFTEDGAARREVDQSAAPAIPLGSVLTAEAGQPEQLVTDAVLNRAPIGEWSVALYPAARVSGLDDLRLTFDVIGTAR